MILFLFITIGSWIVSIIGTATQVDLNKSKAEVKIRARWLLVAIFFGYAMLPILFGWLIRALWIRAELPTIKPLFFRSRDVREEAGSLSIPEERK